MTTRRDPPHHGDTAPDAHLQQALRHAPDDTPPVPPLLSARILAAARAAAPAPRRPWWQRLWPADRPAATPGLGYAGALATVLIAGGLVLGWRGEPPGPGLDGRQERSAPQEAAESSVSTERRPGADPARAQTSAAPAKPAATSPTSPTSATPATATTPASPSPSTKPAATAAASPSPAPATAPAMTAPPPSQSPSLAAAPAAAPRPVAGESMAAASADLMQPAAPPAPPRTSESAARPAFAAAAPTAPAAPAALPAPAAATTGLPLQAAARSRSQRMSAADPLQPLIDSATSEPQREWLLGLRQALSGRWQGDASPATATAALARHLDTASPLLRLGVDLASPAGAVRLELSDGQVRLCRTESQPGTSTEPTGCQQAALAAGAAEALAARWPGAKREPR